MDIRSLLWRSSCVYHRLYFTQKSKKTHYKNPKPQRNQQWIILPGTEVTPAQLYDGVFDFYSLILTAFL